MYLASLDTEADQVEKVIEALKNRYSIEDVFTHIDDQNGAVWLNLDLGGVPAASTPGLGSALISPPGAPRLGRPPSSP